MALVDIGGMPLTGLGGAHRQGILSLASPGSTTLDAAAESVMMIGQVWVAGGVLGVTQKTIDTSGASSFGLRLGTTTFANAGTVVKVGLAAVDTTNGPPGRAVNVSDVITFDVSASLTGGGGGLTTASWNTVVPTAGTKTVTHGDLVAFCVQMTTRGGTDSVLVSTPGAVVTNAGALPTVVNFVGGAYAAQGSYPNVVFAFSDGTLGTLFGAHIINTTITTVTWNNTSNPKEYGNIFRIPAPMSISGVQLNVRPLADLDVVLYSDPFGTPVAERTASIDGNVVGLTTNAAIITVFFPSVFVPKLGADYVVAAKPTSATDISAIYKSLNDASHQVFESLGTTAYAVNRNTGAFSAQNSGKDRFPFHVLVRALSHPARASYALGV